MSRLSRLAVLALLPAASLSAQAHDHAAHAAPAPAAGTSAPREGGQAAFAAIAEIVRLLDADPGTDWSRVNVEALRQHLIDMDEVTMHAADARAVSRIRALGFIGVVALGDHHAPHHLGIANGSMTGMHGH